MWGSQAVARAPADGYTLLSAPTARTASTPSLFRGPGLRPLRDFTPIAPFVTTPTVLAVPPSPRRVRTWRSCSPCRRRPLTFASAGNGTTGHLSQALLNLRGGLNTEHVPYRNGGQAVTDLIAGRVDAMFYHPLAFKPHLEAGTLRALAVTSARRVSTLPDVPTIWRRGLPDFVVEGRWSLYGPAACRREVVARLNRATNALLADPASLANLRAQGVEPLGGTSEAAGRGDAGRGREVAPDRRRCQYPAGLRGRRTAAMADLDQDSVTEAVLAQMADHADPRLREVMAAPVRHLHDFAREVNLTARRMAGRHRLPHRRRPGLHALPAGVHPALRRARPVAAGERDARRRGARGGGRPRPACSAPSSARRRPEFAARREHRGA